MQATLDRRGFLAAAAGGLAAAALGRRAFADSRATALTVRPLAENLAMIEGAGANVVVAATPEELLLVDGGLGQRSAELFALLDEHWPNRKLATLFNTNWRPEHTGSNAAARARGARVFAHENTKLWIGADFRVEWEKKDYRPQPAEALPTDTFYTSGTLELAGERVEYAHLPRAHTDGDIYVFFRNANVLVASDLLAVGGYPLLDYSTGGWIGGMERATRALLDVVDAQTQIVPALGAPQRKPALEDQLALCTAVRERLAQAFRAGMSLADFIATQPAREFEAARGDPAQFLALAYEGGWGHIRELGGVI